VLEDQHAEDRSRERVPVAHHGTRTVGVVGLGQHAIAEGDRDETLEDGLGGLLLEASLTQRYGKSAKAVVTVLERTKFRAMIKPGDSLRYRTEVIALNEAGGKTKATATLDGKPVTATEMTFAFKYLDDPQLDAKRAQFLERCRQPPDLPADA